MCLRAKDAALACIRGSSALQDLERTERVYTNYNCHTWTQVRVNSCERCFQIQIGSVQDFIENLLLKCLFYKGYLWVISLCPIGLCKGPAGLVLIGA